MRKSILIIMALVALNVTNADAKKFYHYGNTLTFLCDDETMTAEVAGTYHVETSGTITVPETFVAKDRNVYTVTAIGDNFLYFNGNSYSLGCTEVVLPKTIKSIGKLAFYKTNIKSINLPEGLESIGEAAFMNSAELELAELPSTLKHLGKQAFFGCTNITISTLPDSIETLGKKVFGGVLFGGKMKSFTFPDHITELPDSFFYMRKGLKELHLPANLKKIGTKVINNTSLKKLEIPEGVTEIAENAFYGNRSLTTFVLPKSMTKIPAGAFAHTGIQNLDFLPEGVTEIGDGAFRGSGLVEANIPEGVTTIGEDVLTECENLETATIPSTAVDVRSWPFDGCYNLKSFTIAEGNTALEMSADSVITCKLSDGRRLLYVPESAIIDSTYVFADDIREIGNNVFGYYKQVNRIEFPEGLRRIGNNNFEFSPLKKVVLPSTLEELGKEVFEYCESLEEVVLPEKLRSIPEGTFHSCGNLSKLNWPGELEEIGANAFDYTSLPSVVILPQSVKRIGADAFHGCKPFEKFVLPEGLKTIETGTFIGTKLPNGIVIPSSVRTIGEAAFESCGLSNIVIPEGVESVAQESFKYNYAKQVSLPSTLRFIGGRAFEKNDFETISLPEGLKVISNYAFDSCLNLKEVVIPYGVSVRPYAFRGCTGLEKVTFPEDLLVIHPGLFAGCTSLKTVVLPKNLIAFENELFDGCSALEEIDFPETLECIGNWAFRGTNLKKADLSHTSLRNIIWEAFADNKSLTEVRLPATCNFVGAKAFAGCDNISVVEVLATEPPTAEAEAFQSPVTELAMLIVPEGSEDAYRNAEVWKEFKNISTRTAVKDNIVDRQDSSPVYDLNGVKLKNVPQRGIYIKGGKKKILNK